MRQEEMQIINREDYSGSAGTLGIAKMTVSSSGGLLYNTFHIDKWVVPIQLLLSHCHLYKKSNCQKIWQLDNLYKVREIFCVCALLQVIS